MKVAIPPIKQSYIMLLPQPINPRQFTVYTGQLYTCYKSNLTDPQTPPLMPQQSEVQGHIKLKFLVKSSEVAITPSKLAEKWSKECFHTTYSRTGNAPTIITLPKERPD